MGPMTLLQLTPEKFIEFPSARLQSVSVSLTLKNITEKLIAYKIKTTAPKNYLVRPSSGVIAPGEDQDVQIVLQPQQTIPTNNSDRFLVQATEVESPSVQLTKDFWTNVPKSQLQDQRLSVVFKPDENTALSSSVATAPISTIAASPAPFSTVITDASELRRSAGPPPAGGSDFEAKYNDLVQYCLALEKQKTILSSELNGLRHESLSQRITSSLCRNCGTKLDVTGIASGAAGFQSVQQGFQLWQVIAMIVGVVIVLKVFRLL